MVHDKRETGGRQAWGSIEDRYFRIHGPDRIRKHLRLRRKPRKGSPVSCQKYIAFFEKYTFFEGWTQAGAGSFGSLRKPSYHEAQTPWSQQPAAKKTPSKDWPWKSYIRSALNLL